MEFFYFETAKERNAFFLDCLSLGIWVEIDYGQSDLYGVKVNIDKTWGAMYKEKGE